MMIILIGLGMGILSGLAIGGGTLLVPALVILANTEQHIAQGVSLAAFIPTAVVAVYTHYRQNNVKIKLALFLAVGSMLGAIVGANLAAEISPDMLRKIFGGFLIAMGFYEFFGKARINQQANEHFQPKN
ncbi:MAG: sulfite exporter TauE/SafE family protein [Clostridia bacterium]|nr:sulfite exporter TauE/SafE family protein [Clostridia bacterium]